VTDHVLGAFSTQEKENLNPIIEGAREAVVTILSKGIGEGMNRFNNRGLIVNG
jgi:peptidyl-tRNA hydrolase